jgi:hypothetical protein
VQLAPGLPRLQLLKLPPPQVVRPDELGERRRPEVGLILAVSRRPAEDALASGRRDDVAGGDAFLRVCRERFVRHAAQSDLPARPRRAVKS